MTKTCTSCGRENVPYTRSMTVCDDCWNEILSDAYAFGHDPKYAGRRVEDETAKDNRRSLQAGLGANVRHCDS